MRVTCKHCGGAHPAFECRKKSTAARIERAEAAGGLQTAQSPNGVAIDDHLKPTEAKQQVSSTVDQPSQPLPVDTNSPEMESEAGPVRVEMAWGQNRMVRGGGPERAPGAEIPLTKPKFDRKAWMREYQRNYMRNVYRPKLKASKSNPNTPERNDE